MRKLFLMILFFTVPAISYGGFVVCNNGDGILVQASSSTAICVTYSIPPSEATDYDRVKNVLRTVPRKYIKWTTEPVEMTQGEKDVVEAEILIDADLSLRSSAKSLYDGQDTQGQARRALIKVLIDEINVLRDLHSLPGRTLSQAKSAIQNAISDGSVDE